MKDQGDRGQDAGQRADPFGAAGVALVLAVVCLGCSADAGGARRALATGAADGRGAGGGGRSIDESRRVFERAKATSDPRERCALLLQAVNLDQASAEARLARAKTTCAPASELVTDARQANAIAPSPESAAVLAEVGMRAESPADAVAGAGAIVGRANADLDRLRLAARAFSTAGEHARAARTYERIAADREAKGANAEAVDARLDAAMASARAHGKGATSSPGADLLDAIQKAASLGNADSARAMPSKVIEAIAVLRNADDPDGAAEAAKRARALKVVATPDDLLSLDLERGVAEARAGHPKALAARIAAEKKAARMAVPISRAALAVEASLAGRCGAAHAYAHAHASHASESLPRLDDDLAWAAACTEGEEIPSLAPPRPTRAAVDLRAVAVIDPARGRALLERYVEAHGDDVAARLALVDVLTAPERLGEVEFALRKRPGEPALHLARFRLLMGTARSAEARQIVETVLPTTIEVIDDPRAAAQTTAGLLLECGDDKETAGDCADVAAALLRACAAASSASACVGKREPIARAVTLLRRVRPTVLAKTGPALCDADLADARSRLGIVLTLVEVGEWKTAEVVAGPKRGGWESPEASVAHASVFAASKRCDLARAKIADWPNLATLYPDEVAAVKKTCP